MPRTTIIDFMATRLPDDAETYPDWTIRCTWIFDEVGGEVSQSFHEGTDERTARALAAFILVRFRDVEVRTLAAVDLRTPGGTWENVPQPTAPVTTPVRFAFQCRPGIPGQRRTQAHDSYL